ncbi:hypothetical protein MOO45_05800 [Bombilactobacillus folatiphilus]|uniref:Polysaccharide polymerase n=1 Tax=Bombilactobacillus folatiphilus TaxID=2923362 RepID=A0ABY4P862_9LACO|nr:hypothetical protein [Bombilactobacillus folatiphilus]UQS81714.1 hypothetical protein MOO45_05800 [Bombilactobacillus folatiphilus]
MTQHFKNNIWLTFYGIYLFWYILLLMSNLNLATKIQMPFFTISIVFSGLFLMFQAYSLSELLTLILGLTLAVVVSLTSHTIVFITLVMFVFSAKGVYLSDFIRVDFWVRCMAILTVIFFWKINLIPNMQVIRDGQLRSSLGFLHPNTLGALLVIICGEIYFLYGTKQTWLSHLLTLGLILLDHLVLDSRSAEIGLWCLLIGHVILYSRWTTVRAQVTKFFKWLGYLGPWLFLVGSTVLIVKFNAANAYFSRLNELFSQRLAYMNYVSTYYPIKFWGQFIPNGPDSYQNVARQTIDNSYFSMLERTGLLATVIFIIYLLMLTQKFAQHHLTSLIILTITFCLISLMESRLNYFQYTIVLLTYLMQMDDKYLSEKERQR